MVSEHVKENCRIQWLISYNLLTRKYSYKTFQFKECLSILTLSKCKDLINLPTRRKNIKKVSTGCKGSFCRFKNIQISLLLEFPIIVSSCALGYRPPPQKNQYLIFAKPLLNLRTVNPPIFRQFLSIYWFFVNTPGKLKSEPPN